MWEKRVRRNIILVLIRKVIACNQNIMNKEVPVANKVIQRRQFEKNNDLLLNRIMTMKFSNISAIKISPSAVRHKPHPHPIQYNKLVHLSDQKHTVKTLIKPENMREENKKIYDRLVSQKPTVSTKTFANERLKNVEFLKRIGKYPYNKVQSIKLDPICDQQTNERIVRCNTMGDLEQTDRINIRVSDHSLSKNKPIINTFAQQQKKEHLIVLYSKVTKLAKNWYTVKFLRFKNHYQIVLQIYPQPKYQYALRLQEKIGTAMLSQNDYDYESIYTNFIKFTNQYVCFSFQLNQAEKKKHFYRFQKRNIQQPSSAQVQGFYQEEGKQTKETKEAKEANKIKEYRKTMFAVENQKLQNEKKQNKHKLNRLNTDSGENQIPSRRLQRFSSLDIRNTGDNL